MNKLSDTTTFEKKSNLSEDILKKVKQAYTTIDAYKVPLPLYDFRLELIKNYNFPLSKNIIKAVKAKKIVPVILTDPVDGDHKKIIRLTTNINTFGDNNVAYADMSSRATYRRLKDSKSTVDSLQIKELDFYAFMHYGYIEYICKVYGDKMDKSAALCKAVASAYATLFVKCVDRDYPISANMETNDIARYLACVFAMVKFFGMNQENASNMILSTTMFNRKQIESSCKTLICGKKFNSLTEFMKVFAEEFSQFIPESSFNPRWLAVKYTYMFGPNALFSLDHACSFLKMVTGPNVNYYKDLIIQKPIDREITAIYNALMNIIE